MVPGWEGMPPATAARARLSPRTGAVFPPVTNTVNFMSRKSVVPMGLGAHELSGSLGVASRAGRLRRAARGLARGGMRCL